MYDYETSEQLFIDIWEKYGFPDEVDDADVIFNILNDLVIESKHRIVLDHYSHINFDEIIKVEYDKENSIFKDINERKKYHQKTGEEKYQFLKELQGELHVFYLKLRTKLQDNKQVELNQMISAVRSSMHAVKSVKDIGTNILDLKNSSKDIKYNFFLHHKKEIENLYLQLNAILLQDKKTNFEELQNIFNTIQSNYSSALNNFYTEVQKTAIEDIDITTVINFNRELFTSNKAILMAIKEIVLDEKLANDFNEIPIYKT